MAGLDLLRKLIHADSTVWEAVCPKAYKIQPMSVQFFDPSFRFCMNSDYICSISVYHLYLLALIAIFTITLSYLYLTHSPSKMLLPLSVGLLATTLYSSGVGAINQEVDPAKSAAIKSAITHLDAFNPLADSDFVYDFNNITSNQYTPGSVIFATAATWPILASGRSAVSQINMGPCAILSPHSHPRATKIAIAVAGSIRTFMRTENGGVDRVTMLTPGRMTIFPKGAMHTMANIGCTNAQLYAWFDSSDPGTMSFGQAMMSVGPDIGLTVMPFIQLVNNDWNQTAAEVPPIGMGAQPGPAECLMRCGLA